MLEFRVKDGRRTVSSQSLAKLTGGWKTSRWVHQRCDMWAISAVSIWTWSLGQRSFPVLAPSDCLLMVRDFDANFSEVFGAICYFWRSWRGCGLFVTPSGGRRTGAVHASRHYLGGRVGRKLNGDRCRVGGARDRSARSACSCRTAAVSRPTQETLGQKDK